MERSGICPICNGTGMKPAEERSRKYGYNGYDPTTDTERCHNCGPKGMFSKGPDGKTTLRPDGTPCVHHYLENKISNCYYRYTCEHCFDSYTIDSGD